MDHFRVLIAGGSLAGLTLALCLEQAGIDYILVEKEEIGPQQGASIGLHPHSLKILDQLGVWKDIEKVIVPLLYRKHYDAVGKCVEDSMVLEKIRDRLRRPIIFMERCEALRILYSHIKDKSKIHPHNALVSYTENDEGVSIITANGDSYQGSILVGADGIHSVVRSLMAEAVSETQPDISKDLVEGFTSEYKCIFAVSRNDQASPMMPDSTVHNVYYNNFSAISATGVPGLVFWFLFAKTSLTRTPKCPRFTNEDMKNLVGQYGHAKVGPSYTIEDLWNQRVKASMAPLEEGVIRQWSHGRVVLIGDAVHKMTINAGLGGNTAYEGVARFSNLLYDLLQQSPNPSLSELSNIFEVYQAAHKPRAESVKTVSSWITRYEAQDTWYLKLALRWLMPYISDATKAETYANFSRQGPWLKFLQDPDLIDKPPRDHHETAAKGSLGTLSFVVVLGFMVALGCIMG
ncbi:FAD/NAD(P)-binding domain-containing protein [Lepidopterella palustris CBS 459.81]|uniref:FAD/NAD(P)-binding domain-containing protein n=1 Tax=Lepidopterella palustris CBS 459.81 TaxID=1314670 RepID=A0A8E2EES5_9PEZI|nr:FAD/NAD(P)-binding domain-containing protein [Lepidopterella palustris CBS 459.81]